MRTLFLSLLICVMGAAPYTVNQEIVYLKPTSFKEYTFSDKYKGFTVSWNIAESKFKTKKIPEKINFYFYGPQPEIVAGNTKMGRQLIIPFSNGRFHIYKNFHGNEVKILAAFRDPPERYKKNWKNFEMKIVGEYIPDRDKRYGMAMVEIMAIKGVVGFGSNNAGGLRIPLAKGHPKLEEVKEGAEGIAKKYGFTVEWKEIDGHDYLWKE